MKGGGGGGLNGGTQLYTCKARAETDDGLDVKMQVRVCGSVSSDNLAEANATSSRSGSSKKDIAHSLNYTTEELTPLSFYTTYHHRSRSLRSVRGYRSYKVSTLSST